MPRWSWALVLALAACSPRAEPPARPRIVAHRGASREAPENTLAAFQRAWDLGVEAIELDVRVTRDGAVVVIHDPTTTRTTGVALDVAAVTLAEIRALDAGSWKHARYAGERIPTLAEVISRTPRGRTVFVEIKSGADTVEAVAGAIRASDAERRGVQIALQGYDPVTLSKLAQALPALPAYWTVDPPTDPPDPPDPQHARRVPYEASLASAANSYGFDGLALDYRMMTEELLAGFRAAELEIDLWTLNDPAELARWVARDVRWLETDRPELAAPRSR